jgi:hypothetical protein
VCLREDLLVHRDRAVVDGRSFRQEDRIYCTSDGTLKGGDVFGARVSSGKVRAGHGRSFVVMFGEH